MTLFFAGIPHIEQDPQDITVNFGEAAMFTCIASGDPEPEIVWLKDSNEVPVDNTRYEVMNNGTLMVHDITDVDGSYFECMAKNPAGVVHSKPAKLIINNQHSIHGKLFNLLEFI